MKANMIGTVTLDVILRGQGPNPVETCVGTITVPVTAGPLGAAIEPEAIDRALGSFGDEHVAPDTTRRRRRGGFRKARA